MLASVASAGPAEAATVEGGDRSRSAHGDQLRHVARAGTLAVPAVLDQPRRRHVRLRGAPPGRRASDAPRPAAGFLPPVGVRRARRPRGHEVRAALARGAGRRPAGDRLDAACGGRGDGGGRGARVPADAGDHGPPGPGPGRRPRPGRRPGPRPGLGSGGAARGRRGVRAVAAHAAPERHVPALPVPAGHRAGVRGRPAGRAAAPLAVAPGAVRRRPRSRVVRPAVRRGAVRAAVRGGAGVAAAGSATGRSSSSCSSTSPTTS